MTVATPSEISWTPIEARVLAALADGAPHRPEVLLACLGDEMATINNLWVHLSRMRAKLRPLGEDIVCVIHNRKMHYRHMRTLPRPSPQPEVNS